MAECHPVGFQWVMEAKARGAKIIHIDPRFTRTSAVSDTHVPLRAGSDIVFLGGIVKYILDNEKYFAEYVTAYTNASFLVSEDFVDSEDLGGLFSGFDEETGSYDPKSWSYEGVEETAAAGNSRNTAAEEDGSGNQASGHSLGSGGAGMDPNDIKRDTTLQHPRSVVQFMKRHYARYTP